MKKFEMVEMEIVEFKAEDVITASGMVELPPDEW